MADDTDYKKLKNFQTFLEYFEYYIHDIIRKNFENTTGESGFTTGCEASQQNICVMLNTSRCLRRDSDIIVKTRKSLEVSCLGCINVA
jgi:hypothetical protein